MTDNIPCNRKVKNVNLFGIFSIPFYIFLQSMNEETSPNTSATKNDFSTIHRGTGAYWVRIDDAWFLTKYYDHEDLFYFLGYFDGVEPKELHEIDERKLDKKFEGHKSRTHLVEQAKLDRQEGYYWIMHDAMWFAAYYLSSKNEFYFPGQTIGFDPQELEEIDEQSIVRSIFT